MNFELYNQMKHNFKFYNNILILKNPQKTPETKKKKQNLTPVRFIFTGEGKAKKGPP